MIAFAVSVNGEHYRTCGIRDAAMLEVRASYFSQRNNELLLMLGAVGASSSFRECLTWQLPTIKVGDKVCVEIIETDRVDPPSEREPMPEPTTGPDGISRIEFHEKPDKPDSSGTSISNSQN
jgi:hypothetical protein